MKELQTLQGLQERLVVDTSEGQPVYLLAVGQNLTYIRLSPTSYYLLQQRSLGISFESLAEILSQSGKYISSDQVETAYNDVIERITKIEQNSHRKASPYFFRFTILPKAIVNSIAAYLSIAFYWPVACCLLLAMAVSAAIAPQHDFHIDTSVTGFLWSYLLFFASLMMHELGHASACARYGAEPSDIGFTLYLIWPAFYSDVSDAWRLKRWQRVIVDVAGVFFQLIFAAIYVVAYSLTGWVPLKLALIMIAGSCLFTLNPIFKFDGYWVMADTLGVTNLSQQPLRIFRHYLDRCHRRKVKSFPWPIWVMGILMIYTILSFIIWGYFLWVVIPIFWQELWKYPSLVNGLVSHFWRWPPVIDIKILQSFMSSTVVIVISILMLSYLTKLLRIALFTKKKPK